LLSSTQFTDFPDWFYGQLHILSIIYFLKKKLQKNCKRLKYNFLTSRYDLVWQTASRLSDFLFTVYSGFPLTTKYANKKQPYIICFRPQEV